MDPQQHLHDELEGRTAKRHRGLGYEGSDQTPPAPMQPSEADGFQDALARARALAAQFMVGQVNKQAVPSGGGRSFRRVIIPKEPPGFNYVGVVLGPQGSNQRRMQEEYGCRIRIKDEGEEKEFPDAHVAIEGDSPEGVERAYQDIYTLFNDKDKLQRVKDEQLRQLAGGSEGEPREVVHVSVPTNMVGLLIGRGGDKIKELQERSGARIQVQRDSEAEPSAKDRQVSMFGTKEEVERAQQMVAEIIREAASKDQYGPGGGTTLNLSVPAALAGHIIGRGGETVNYLKAQTGAYIQVQKEEDEANPGERTIIIKGTKEQVDKAHFMVRQKLDEGALRDQQRAAQQAQQAALTRTMKIPNKDVGRLIGKSGETIRALQQETGCRIQVAREAETATDERIITIQSPLDVAMLDRAEKIVRARLDPDSKEKAKEIMELEAVRRPEPVASNASAYEKYYAQFGYYEPELHGPKSYKVDVASELEKAKRWIEDRKSQSNMGLFHPGHSQGYDANEGVHSELMMQSFPLAPGQS